MRAIGLRVFLDEDGIGHFSGITTSIESALGSSKCLVAYYSATYAVRPACQLELMAAFLAGQREGDASRRILVINPERSTAHLQPVELADAKYADPPITGDDANVIAHEIQRRIGSLDGVIGEASLKARRRWFGRRLAGGLGFSGRYRELWSLHSSLHSADFPLILEPYYGTAVAVYGLPGAGKTALVMAYAWQFGAAYPGGVYWLSLSGVTGSRSEVVEGYRREVRRIAPFVGVDSAGEHEVFATVADTFARCRQKSLWIIDDLPTGLDPSALDSLLLPAGGDVRTVLISQEDVFSAVMPSVRVGPLTADDAHAVLARRRPSESHTERAARDRLASALGYHAGAMVAIGDHLQDRQGLTSYSEFEGDVSTGRAHLAGLAEVRELLERLSTDERFLLNLAAACQSEVLPTSLLKQVSSCHDIDVGAALTDLRRRAIAEREGTSWRIHPLAVTLLAET